MGNTVLMCHDPFDERRNRSILLGDVEERDDGLDALVAKRVILPPRGEEPKRKPALLVR
jgi:hypothetical protein